MAKYYQLILLSLILIFEAGNQTSNNISCQANLFNVNRNSKSIARNARVCRIKKYLAQNSRILATKLNNAKKLPANNDALKGQDPFNLRAVTDDSYSKSLKIVKILQENLALTKLKSMDHLLKVDTLVLYGFSQTIFETGSSFLKNLPPLLIISRQTFRWQLSELYNNNILSIIFLGAGYSSLDAVFTTLKQSLKRLHLNKIIIIKETAIAAAENDELHIINWLHSNGFWQSLLMDFEGTSLTLQHLTGELKWNLTVEEFLLQTTQWRNLLGYPINCTMASNPPRAYIQYDSQKNVILKGYFGTIIDLFAKHYNASLKPFILSNLDYYTELDCVKYIEGNKVDICGDGLPSHEQYVITYPEEIVASYLMVPSDEPLPRFYYFLKPFQLDVWSIVTISFFYKIITLSLIHRLQQGSWNGSLQMLYAVQSILYQPFQLTYVKRPYRRFLEFLMILVGFVVSNWYLSVLSSLLFTRLHFHNIKTLQNLADHNISIMVDEFELFVLNATENDAILMQQLKLVSNEILLQHRRNLDPQYAYYSQYDKVAFYLHQQKYLIRPRLKVLTGIPPINEIIAGIPMRSNWPFQHLLNDFIFQILANGLNQHIYTNALEEGIHSGYLDYFATEHHSGEPLSIEYFQMPAILLAVGYSLAFVGLLWELFVKRNLERLIITII